MSSSSSSRTISVPLGHVALVLLHRDPTFYLQMPFEVITALCLKPRKYLRYLGWCVLGAEGKLVYEPGGPQVYMTGGLGDGEIYYYEVTSGHIDRRHGVDPEVIQIRTSVSSGSVGQRRANFRAQLLERDAYCVFSGLQSIDGQDAHIIPHSRGSEWLTQIVANRPKYNEDITGLNDVNDVRNGIFVNSLIHGRFDRHDVAVLKTPNPMLTVNDIPANERLVETLNGGISYPQQSRYTLQWIHPGPTVQAPLPFANNLDAAFRQHAMLPSDLLLHYRYGAAAVKLWGKEIEAFRQYMQPFHPSPSEPLTPPTLGLPKTIHNRTIAIHKRGKSRATGDTAEGSSAGVKAGGLKEPEDETKWDGEDVVLFLWANSPAAIERRLEHKHSIEQWRSSIS